MSSMLETNGLACRLGAKTILSGVSLRVERGEFLVLAGPNGAGKSTLLRCLAGSLPCTGSLKLLGRPLSEYSRKACAREVAYVPQIVGRLPGYSAREFVEMARYPYLGPFSRFGASAADAVEHALRLTATEQLAQRNINTLSGGERQRVLLAAALCQEPNLLLLDEPAAFLDPYHEAELYELLQRLHSDRQLTLIVVSHDINRALLSCQRVLGLRAGELIFDGRPDEFMTDAVLQQLFDVEVHLLPHPETGLPMMIPS